jgi:hypothetical protein
MAEQASAASAASAAAARRGGARPPTAARPGLSRLHALESEAYRRQPMDETDEAHCRQPELLEDEATGAAGMAEATGLAEMAEADATGAAAGQSTVSGRRRGPPPPPVTILPASAGTFAASSPWLPIPGIAHEEDEYDEDGDGGVEDDEDDGDLEDEKLDLNDATLGEAVLLDDDAEDEPQDDDEM